MWYVGHSHAWLSSGTLASVEPVRSGPRQHHARAAQSWGPGVRLSVLQRPALLASWGQALEQRAVQRPDCLLAPHLLARWCFQIWNAEEEETLATPPVCVPGQPDVPRFSTSDPRLCFQKRLSVMCIPVLLWSQKGGRFLSPTWTPEQTWTLGPPSQVIEQVGCGTETAVLGVSPVAEPSCAY